MTREEMQSLARLDEAVERLAEGCYTLPADDMPHYDIRAITKEAEKLGRALTDDEAEEFIIGA